MVLTNEIEEGGQGGRCSERCGGERGVVRGGERVCCSEVVATNNTQCGQRPSFASWF